MKVRMRVQVSGDRNGAPWPPRGSVVDLPDAEAAEYCAAGMADPVADYKTAETAVSPKAEERGAAEPPAEKSAGLTKKTGPRGG